MLITNYHYLSIRQLNQEIRKLKADITIINEYIKTERFLKRLDQNLEKHFKNEKQLLQIKIEYIEEIIRANRSVITWLINLKQYLLIIQHLYYQH